MRKIVCGAAAGIAALSGVAGIQIECDRASHLYRVGETAEFSIRSDKRKPLTVEFSNDGAVVLEEKEVVPPVKLRYTLSHPGVLRCTVKAKGETTAMLGVAFDPDQVRPALPEPEDFDSFWKAAFAKLAETPENFKMTERRELATPEFSIYDLECGNVNGTKVYGYLKMPKTDRKIPLLVYVEGAGPGQELENFQVHCATVSKFLKSPVAVLTIGVHAYKPAEKREDHLKQHAEYLEKLGVKSYWLEGIGQGAEKSFFYRAILGAARMCNLVSALPRIDRNRIGYLGASQGGGFGLFLTALCPQIRAAFCGVPAFGDCGGFLTGSHTTQSNIPELKKHYGELRYFDAVNFARRIKVPVFITSGFVDSSCPPTSVFAIANELGGPKLVFHKVKYGHGGGPEEYEPLTWFWIGRHLGLPL